MVSSYNGWPASPDPNTLGIDQSFQVAGVTFPGGVKSGDVATVLGYVAAQINDQVEQLNAGQCWGYEFRRNVNDASTLSCHSSGTAIDVNAPLHPNGVTGTWTPAQVDWIRHILATVGGLVVWGEDWADGMHFEIQGTPADLEVLAKQLSTANESSSAAPPMQGSQDMPVTSEEMDAIAARVITALEKRLIRSNFAVADATTGQKVEKARDANLFETTASANTNSTRIYLGKYTPPV